MSTPRPEHRNRRTKLGSDGSRSVRWRLWAAMLALALAPTIAGIYLTTSLLSAPDASLAAQRTRASAESAASLLAREQAIEARLLVAANDPELARVANGIDGSGDHQLAQQTLKNLRDV